MYSFKVFDGTFSTTYLTSGNPYNDGVSCVYPLDHSECISDCEDSNKNSQCVSCNCDESCLTDPNQCIECAPNCNGFCDHTQCIDILTYCSPHPYDPDNATCLWGVICISDCQHCLNNTECITCNTGLNVQPDLTCATGCPPTYYKDNGVCLCLLYTSPSPRDS